MTSQANSTSACKTAPDAGRKLLDSRELFITRRVKHTFSGYAHSQMKRIDAHYRWLKHPPTAQPTRAEFGLPDRTLIPQDQLNQPNPLRPAATKPRGLARRDTMQSALAKKQTISDLVGIYEQAAADIKQAFELINNAERTLCEAFDGGFHDDESAYRSISVQGRYNHCKPDWSKPEETMRAIDRKIWDHLIDKMEVKRMMSVKAAADLDKQLASDELPPISMQSIEAMASGFQMQASDFLTDAVKEVFEFLRPRSNGATPKYKRNSEFEVPRRVVLPWMVEGSSRGLRIMYGFQGDRDQYLVALENVLNSLDGKGSIAKTHKSAIYNAMVEQGPHGETDLFKYHAYHNRNLHLEFKRLDLLAKLNQIAGGKRLRKKAA